jgi:hypothetical protein
MESVGSSKSLPKGLNSTSKEGCLRGSDGPESDFMPVPLDLLFDNEWLLSKSIKSGLEVICLFWEAW